MGVCAPIIRRAERRHPRTRPRGSAVRRGRSVPVRRSRRRFAAGDLRGSVPSAEWRLRRRRVPQASERTPSRTGRERRSESIPTCDKRYAWIAFLRSGHPRTRSGRRSRASALGNHVLPRAPNTPRRPVSGHLHGLARAEVLLPAPREVPGLAGQGLTDDFWRAWLSYEQVNGRRIDEQAETERHDVAGRLRRRP